MFLALFFLIPRTPYAWLEGVKSKETLNTDGSASFSFVGMHAFKNNNYFAVHWSNPSMNLYWLPTSVSGQVILEACSGSAVDATKACEFYTQDGFCAINIGTFSQAGGFFTNPLDTTHEELTLSQNKQQTACSLQMMVAQGVHHGQLLFSKGTIHAEGMVRDFGNVAVGETLYTFE
jgi:hypothetical protein